MFTIHSITQYVLDVLFPIHCLSCDREGEWLCLRCAKLVRLNSRQACPVCRQSRTGAVCSACRLKTPLDGLLVACDYDQPIVKTLTHSFKYLPVPSLVHPITSLMWQCLCQIKGDNWPDVLRNKQTIITPVPLHTRRFRNRGFNQSELIADELAHFVRLRVVQLLDRHRYTDSQMTLDRPDRLKNVVGAFTLAPDFEKMPENVIIIDDVATTGATLHECASVLKSHGAKTVWGFVVARGS